MAWKKACLKESARHRYWHSAPLSAFHSTDDCISPSTLALLPLLVCLSAWNKWLYWLLIIISVLISSRRTYAFGRWVDIFGSKQRPQRKWKKISNSLWRIFQICSLPLFMKRPSSILIINSIRAEQWHKKRGGFYLRYTGRPSWSSQQRGRPSPLLHCELK